MIGSSDKKSLQSLLGLATPIIQAPMAGVSTPALAAAVTNAGGLGSIGIGAVNAEGARKSIREIRALTSGPFNVNVFCHAPAISDEAVERAWLTWLSPHFELLGARAPDRIKEIYTSFVKDDATVAVLLEEQPAVVSFHFGLPSSEVIRALKDAGLVLFASATNLDEAGLAVEAGIDVIVAQGIEAGGHRGVFDPDAYDEGLGTFALTRLLAERCSVPVVAAGGIMDGAGITAALALGAQAAQLGTAFVACPETGIDDGYRRALLIAGVRTVQTRAISGRPARSVANRFTALGQQPNAPQAPDYPIAYDAGKALHAAAKLKGDYGFGAQWAGQAVGLSRGLPAAELMARLEAELKYAVRHLQAFS